ncbi:MULTISPECIES: DNA -binding domain-containing protein [unclassified Sphingobium]|uniref:DNA -binding domain-containing protein n=1 Tax=unclassified Sphingobium TaxID=2611147 RepID=UPI0035A6005B
MQRFRARSGNARQHDRLAKQLFALKAIDAHEAGASLREVAALLLPSEEWPGDGEHRKSFVRRLIVKGRHLVRAGPACILRPKRITPGYR